MYKGQFFVISILRSLVKTIYIEFYRWKLFWNTNLSIILVYLTLSLLFSFRLTNLFNQPVKSVRPVQRPMNGFLGKIGFKHSGVVVTTKGGKDYLVHKGKGYGSSSQTVVVDAKHMSNRWSNIGNGKTVNGKTIGDFVTAGGTNYDPLFNNCHHARNRMDKLGKRKAC